MASSQRAPDIRKLNFRPMIEEYDLFILEKPMFVEILLLTHYCVIIGLKTCIENSLFYLIYLFICNFLKNSSSPVLQSMNYCMLINFINGAKKEKHHLRMFYFFYHLQIYFYRY